MESSSDLRRLSSSSCSSNHEAPTPLLTPSVPTNVQVAVRCRPLSSREKAAGRGAVVQCKPHSSEVAIVKRKTYTFDRVFGQYSTQKDVFNAVVRPAVDEALAGYNCTVFAYGQTGTGKTYTMQGDLTPGSETAGIIPRSVRCIFDALEANGEEFSVRVSFLQLYNEELKDLLDPDTGKKLRLMEDAKKGGIYCVNLLELTATTAKHVYELVNTGVKNRITSETLMNENSSRSHSIFTIRIHSKEHNAAGEDLLRVGQLNLVDLAGSECVGRSGARNARAREAGTINQSLLTLGRVITALVDNLPHVPYRDSKLTRLLQESLGGRAKTTIIATLAPCADSLDETLSTLEYAFRAKHIKNKPELNQKMTKSGLLNDFENEIETLRAALRAARLKDGVYLPLEQYTDMQERLSGQAVQLMELEDILKARNSSCKELEEVAEKNASEVAAVMFAKQEMSDKLAATQVELVSTKEAVAKMSDELERVKVALKAFQDNEQVLLANGIIAAKLYDAREKQAAQLLTTIENTQRTEEMNTELAITYRGTTQSQINTFLERLAKHKQTQENMFDDVSSSLHELQTTQSTYLNGLVTSLNAMEGLVGAHKLQTIELVADDDALRLKQCEEATTSTREQQKSVQKQLEKLVKMSKCHTAAIIESVSNSESRNVSCLENMQSALEGSRAELTTFLAEQSTKLHELQAAIDTSVEKQVKELDESKAVLTAALRDSHVRHQEELCGLKENLAQYIEKCIQNQNEKLNEQTLLIEETAKHHQKQLSCVQTLTEQEVKGVLQAIDGQSAKHVSETAELRGRFSKMQDQLADTNAQQTELVQSHERLQTTLCNATGDLATKHTGDVTSLSDKHLQVHTATSKKRREQLVQFVGEHEELRKRLDGERKALEEGFHTQVLSTKGKVELISALGKDVVGEATVASNQQLQDMEAYMKKRKIHARSGFTPTKNDDQPFPSFKSTNLSDLQLDGKTNPTSRTSSPSSTEPGRKRQRTNDGIPSTFDNDTRSTEDCAAPCQRNASVSTTTSQATVGITASHTDEDTRCADTVSSTECMDASGTSLEARSTEAKSVVTPSKLKKAAVSGMHKKKLPTVTTINRSTKVPSAGPASRKTTTTSSLTIPKRYRIKSPVGDPTTNSR